VICSSCGNQNAENARFCNGCGATLQAQSDKAAGAILGDGAVLEQKQRDPRLGKSIDGRYRIDGLVGVGGMGTVYRATRLLIGDEVAIKILHPDQTDANSSERFRREAQAAARLKHPNAVSIYDFGVSADGLQYLVMEFVEGESLREATKQGPLGFAAVVEIISQVCAALDEAHRRHIIHRDIKPDNIIIDSTPGGLRVKVLDFGIAKLRDDTASHITQTGSVMGTPHYMSPEQCLGEELDSRADIYSVGIVLYEMLCGRVPFNSPISTAVVVQHVSQPPPSLREINPAVPRALEAVVLHAIEKARNARPPTAGELAQELRAALRGEDAPAHSVAGFQAPLSFPPNVVSDEETIERRKAVSPSQPDLSKTVYLPSPRGGSPSLGGVSRLTAENGAATTASLKQSIPTKYVGAGLAALAIVALVLVFALWPRADKEKKTTESVASRNTQPAQETASNPPVSSPAQPKAAVDQGAPAGMVAVVGGDYLMGSNVGDPDSRPAHLVTVKPFYLDAHEVTCEAYKRFVDKDRSAMPANWTNGTYPPGTGNQPVTGITWEQATAYARSIGKRLPTEQEWEFAARGPAGLPYPWGTTWKRGCANAADEGRARNGLTNVGSYNCESPFGVQDLIGNAWEWTASDWSPYPGGRLANPSSGGEKVIRGGSWESAPNYASATYRSGYKGVGDKTGFRCAMDMP